MNNFYTKIVNTKELNFFILASKHKITPRFISYSKNESDDVSNDSLYSLSMEFYPENLNDVMKNPSRKDEALFIIEQTRKIINILHSIDILHNDISEENIVYDRSNRSVAIIDFGLSTLISTILPSEISDYIENLYEGINFAGFPSNTIEYLLRVELGILTFLEHSINK